MNAEQLPGDIETAEHFIGHVAGSTREVEVTEDILTSSGMKLLARGARIDATTRDRLLGHRLAKPIEQCIAVADAISRQTLAGLAERLLDEHQALRILAGNGKGRSAVAALDRLGLPARLGSLLTLYSELPSRPLEHAVSVALIGHAVAAKVLPDGESQERVLLVAGLFHDIGELYLDPVHLEEGASLGPAHWKHIVAHPIIGHRMLRDMDGAGRLVAEAVLHHHERRDGHGYPSRLSGDDVSTRGEIIAAAEWLAGLLRSPHASLATVATVTRLMPGGFRESIVRAITPEAGGDPSRTHASLLPEPGDILARLARIGAAMSNYRRERRHVEELAGACNAASPLAALAGRRMERIERSLVASGLAVDEPLALFEQVNAVGDPEILLELGAILREVEWRLRELEREMLLRAERLPARDRQAVLSFVEAIRPA